MTYRIIKLMDHDVIQRILDLAFIPADPANTDYQQYLAWVADGNTAEEWNPQVTEGA